MIKDMVISLNYCSQNGGNVYRAPYYNRNPNIGPRIIGNLDQSSYKSSLSQTKPNIRPPSGRGRTLPAGLTRRKKES